MMKEITANPEASEIPKNDLASDLKGIFGKADDLIKEAGHSVADELAVRRHAISEKACGTAMATDEYARANPWKIAGIAAVAGVVIGALISRR